MKNSITAERFIGIIREYGMSVDTFLELQEQFEGMDVGTREEIFNSQGDRKIEKQERGLTQ